MKTVPAWMVPGARRSSEVVFLPGGRVVNYLTPILIPRG